MRPFVYSFDPGVTIGFAIVADTIGFLFAAQYTAQQIISGSFDLIPPSDSFVVIEQTPILTTSKMNTVLKDVIQALRGMTVSLEEVPPGIWKNSRFHQETPERFKRERHAWDAVCLGHYYFDKLQQGGMI